MKRSLFTETQIVSILREYDAGTPIAELARNEAIASSRAA